MMNWHCRIKGWTLFSFIVLGVALASPILFFLPAVSGDDRIYIERDTLCIQGLYSLEVPLKQVASVKYDVELPAIARRTNGVSIGSVNIGHFETVAGHPVLLYLNSNTGKIIYVQTNTGVQLYINFKDANKTKNFVKLLECR